MFEWIKQKIEKINTILDIGVVLSVIFIISSTMIYIYKLILLIWFTKIPFQLAMDVVDIKNIDFLFGVFCTIIFSLIQAIYYYLAVKNKQWKKASIGLFGFCIIFSVLLKFDFREFFQFF